MKLSKRMSLIWTLAGTLALFSGCLKNGEEDYGLLGGQENTSGTDLAKDVAALGAAFEPGDFGGNAPLAKISSAAENELDLSLQGWSYSNGWWTRSGSLEITGEEGAQILLEGSDKVQWKTPANDVVQFPRLEGANSGVIQHSARVYLLNARGGYIDIHRDYELMGSITTDGGDSVLTFNGSLEQSFSAENAAKSAMISVEGTATAEGITWIRGNGSWGKPVSGTIHMESNFRIIEIEFENGVAHVEVTGKNDTFHNQYDVTL